MTWACPSPWMPTVLLSRVLNSWCLRKCAHLCPSWSFAAIHLTFGCRSFTRQQSFLLAHSPLQSSLFCSSTSGSFPSVPCIPSYGSNLASTHSGVLHILLSISFNAPRWSRLLQLQLASQVVDAWAKLPTCLLLYRVFF